MNHFFWGSVLCAENKFAHKYLLVPNQLHFKFWHIKLARKAARLEPIIDFYQPIKPVLVNPTKYHLEHLLNQNRVCNAWILKSTQLNWSNSIKLNTTSLQTKLPLQTGFFPFWQFLSLIKLDATLCFYMLIDTTQCCLKLVAVCKQRHLSHGAAWCRL